MRKNMKKLTVATVIGAMTVTALAPVSAQAKDKTLTVAIWDNCEFFHVFSHIHPPLFVVLTCSL